MSPGSHARDMSDPLQLAVEVTEVKGTLAVLTQQVSTGLGNVSSQIASVQAEQRDQGRALQEVLTAQHDMQSHSEGLERLARAIDRNSAEFAAWREKHEGDNARVSDRVTSHSTGIKVSWALFMVIAGLVAAYSELRFRRADEMLAQHIQFGTEVRGNMQDRMNQMDSDRQQMRADIRELQDRETK
jgi:hypothetical protein